MPSRTNCKFTSMTRDQLIAYCRAQYEEGGLAALTYKSLSAEKGLYFNLYQNGITQAELVRVLGLEDAFHDYKTLNWERKRNGKISKRWTWERVIDEAKRVTDENGFLPPAAWFQVNGRGSFVAAIYGLGKTWSDLRTICDSFHGSSFVESRNGMRWRSHPEASLSNFLYARGITHELGRKYSPGFSEATGLAYGYYDMQVLDKWNRQIDVEIWGEKPNGHNEEFYAKKRTLKEKFNAANPSFLGIEFRDCYSEERLELILEPYIGEIIPYVFDRPTDRMIPSTHWSNADELLEYCGDFAKQQSDGKFPTEEWLRKRGKWKDREGPAYNTLAIYIRLWIGGVRKLREILGQSENSTKSWNRENALSAYETWYKSYGRSPSSMRKMHQRGQLAMTEEELRSAANIAQAARTYVGNTETVHGILGLPTPRKSRAKR